jgi:hypothetical protein
MFLDNGVTDCGEAALHGGSSLPPGKFLVLVSTGEWTDSRAIVRLKKFSKIIGNRIRDLRVCSIVAQPLRSYILQLFIQKMNTAGESCNKQTKLRSLTVRNQYISHLSLSLSPLSC